MGNPIVERYTYTKDSGETSNRELIRTERSQDVVMCLDVTGVDPEEQQRLLNLQGEYATYRDEAMKANVKTFKKYLEDRGIAVPLNFKSFKAAGLQKVS